MSEVHFFRKVGESVVWEVSDHDLVRKLHRSHDYEELESRHDKPAKATEKPIEAHNTSEAIKYIPNEEDTVVEAVKGLTGNEEESEPEVKRRAGRPKKNG